VQIQTLLFTKKQTKESGTKSKALKLKEEALKPHKQIFKIEKRTTHINKLDSKKSTISRVFDLFFMHI
jgi:hypothetical protein